MQLLVMWGEGALAPVHPLDPPLADTASDVSTLEYIPR